MTKIDKRIASDDLFETIRKASISEIAHKLKDCIADGDKRAEEARFAVLLGAGASIGAGIMTADEMINDFRNKILVRDCPQTSNKQDQKKWIKENILDIGHGNEYSKLFEWFERTPRGRQQYISKLLRGKEPTFGYAMLASLIARGLVNTILTTNFDDLAFVGCTKFTGVRPVIYAYGIMATEMKFSLPHPKILKLHGDYLYSALANTESEMSHFNQDPNMKAQVTSALDEYELIVFGYSGNDESVMKILESYPPNKEFYWCYWSRHRPNQRVLELVNSKNGSLVPIEGFDDSMYEIYKVVGFELDEVLASYEVRRTEILKYIDEFEIKYPTNIVEEAISEGKQFTRNSKREKSDNWIDFLIPAHEAMNAGNFTEAQRLYRKAYELNPNSPLMNVYMGSALAFEASKSDEALQFLENAIRLEQSTEQGLSWMAFANLAIGFARIGEYERGLICAERAHKLEPSYLDPVIIMSSIYKRQNKIAQAQRLARQVIKTGNFYDLACAYVNMDDTDQAFDNLEKALAANEIDAASARKSFTLEPIKSHPRFEKLTALP